MLFGWILTWFNIDTLVVNGINQVFNTDYNVGYTSLLILFMV